MSTPPPVDTDRLKMYYLVREGRTEFQSSWAMRHILSPAVPGLVDEVLYLRKELADRDEELRQTRHHQTEESRHLAVLLCLSRGGDLPGQEINDAGRWAQGHIDSGHDVRCTPGGRWEYFPADPKDWFLRGLLTAAADGLEKNMDDALAED